ncbi:hypothetical protein QUC31_001204 [Theobroma cacao]
MKKTFRGISFDSAICVVICSTYWLRCLFLVQREKVRELPYVYTHLIPLVQVHRIQDRTRIDFRLSAWSTHVSRFSTLTESSCKNFGVITWQFEDIASTKDEDKQERAQLQEVGSALITKVIFRTQVLELIFATLIHYCALSARVL